MKTITVEEGVLKYQPLNIFVPLICVGVHVRKWCVRKCNPAVYVWWFGRTPSFPLSQLVPVARPVRVLNICSVDQCLIIPITRFHVRKFNRLWTPHKEFAF